MKLFRKIIKNEIHELFSQKILVNVLFTGIIFLDALGAVLPEYLDRQVTLFIPLPLIFLIYVVNANKKNRLFLCSLILNFLGIYHFNNPYEKYQSIGLVFHAMAFLCYFLILYKHHQVIISIKRILKFSFIIVIIAGIPTVTYSKGMIEKFLFYETMTYAFSVTIFIFSTTLLYLNKKTKTNRFLFFSTLCIIVSSYLQGYNLFMYKSRLLEFFSIILFNLTHYFMCWYLIEKSKENVSVN